MMESSDSKWIKLQAEYTTAANDFFKSCQKLVPASAEQTGVCGSWSAKQVVAHITGWEKEVLNQFKKLEQGTVLRIRYKIDDFNRQSVESRSHMSWEQTIQELSAAQQELQSFINKLSIETVNRNKRFTDWLKILAEHYPHHLLQIQKIVK
jgi:hypothetical protein